jgi:hypothetical protein
LITFLIVFQVPAIVPLLFYHLKSLLEILKQRNSVFPIHLFILFNELKKSKKAHTKSTHKYTETQKQQNTNKQPNQQAARTHHTPLIVDF